jgi:uncharacterized membrane protein YoaK (UPF0700 family)
VQHIEAGSIRDRRLRDLPLVALTVASGAVDAISYLALGKTFSAFMTGNIVFLLVAFTSTLAGSRSPNETPRLAGVLLGLVAGAVAGGVLFVHARGYAPALPLAITVLVLLAGRAMQGSRETLASR